MSFTKEVLIHKLIKKSVIVACVMLIMLGIYGFLNPFFVSFSNGLAMGQMTNDTFSYYGLTFYNKIVTIVGATPIVVYLISCLKDIRKFIKVKKENIDESI